MNCKLIYLFLASLLLTQCCLSAPAVDSNDSKSAESSGSSEEVPTIASILEFVLKGVHELSTNLLIRGSEILKQIIKDESVIKVDTPVMQEYIQNFTQLTEKMDKVISENMKDVEQLLPATEEFIDAVDSINATLIEDPTNEQIVLSAALQKYFTMEIKQELLQVIKKYGLKFNKKINEYAATLPEVKTEDQETFMTWYKAYNAETDNYKKGKMFISFLVMNFPNSAETLD